MSTESFKDPLPLREATIKEKQSILCIDLPSLVANKVKSEYKKHSEFKTFECCAKP